VINFFCVKNLQLNVQKWQLLAPETLTDWAFVIMLRKIIIKLIRLLVWQFYHYIIVIKILQLQDCSVDMLKPVPSKARPRTAVTAVKSASRTRQSADVGTTQVDHSSSKHTTVGARRPVSGTQCCTTSANQRSADNKHLTQRQR